MLFDLSSSARQMNLMYYCTPSFWTATLNMLFAFQAGQNGRQVIDCRAMTEYSSRTDQRRHLVATSSTPTERHIQSHLPWVPGYTGEWAEPTTGRKSVHHPLRELEEDSARLQEDPIARAFGTDACKCVQNYRMRQAWHNLQFTLPKLRKEGKSPQTISINHCEVAQDLFPQTIRESNVDVPVVSELYRNYGSATWMKERSETPQHEHVKSTLNRKQGK